MARNAGKGGLKEVTVNRIENEGQHDRIPFFDVEGMRALVCFRVASSSRKMVRRLVHSSGSEGCR